MRQLNRRAYLLQMGAGAAGLVAASELPLLGQRRRPNRTQTQSGGRRTVQSPFLKWPTTDTKPKADAFVTVIYAGLACLAYNDRQPDNEFVDVVFHPGNGGHKLEIQVYTDPPLDPDQCNPPEIIPSKKSDRLRFEVSGQTGGTANVFQVDSKCFDRNTSDSLYDYDFRWMPDLHSPDFYPEGYGLKPVSGTRLAVPTGTFYTRLRTGSTFSLVTKNDSTLEIRDFGHVALYMATAIDTRNEVRLLNQQNRVLKTFDTNHKYQIVFNNECEQCEPYPDDPNETKRNDFHFSRDVVNIPLLGRLKYSLKRKESCETNGNCAKLDFCISYHRHQFLTDEAPCSAAGYGRASGF